MILATVGTQLPFPRLMQAMDEVAATLAERVVAQTGDTESWPHMDAARDFDMARMDALFTQARVIVAHAGIGTVLAARTALRPLILVPRQAALAEHRNDHQQATARALEGTSGVRVCWDTCALRGLLQSDIEMPEPQAGPLQDSLISAVRSFVAA